MTSNGHVAQLVALLICNQNECDVCGAMFFDTADSECDGCGWFFCERCIRKPEYREGCEKHLCGFCYDELLEHEK